jgi:hypothetical protein
MAQALFGGSSEEYWTMNESLIQQYYVNDEGLYYCKVLSMRRIMTLLIEEVPTNLVPAVAVIRGGKRYSTLLGVKRIKAV